MKILDIIVSRPCAALRSNGGHGNKYAINAARQAAKREAWAVATAALNGRVPTIAKGVPVNIEYTELLHRGERSMDDDNLTGGMKPYRDGIAIALGINDACMVTQPRGPYERGDVSGVSVRVWIDEGAK